MSKQLVCIWCHQVVHIYLEGLLEIILTVYWCSNTKLGNLTPQAVSKSSAGEAQFF